MNSPVKNQIDIDSRTYLMDTIEVITKLWDSVLTDQEAAVLWLIADCTFSDGYMDRMLPLYYFVHRLMRNIDKGEEKLFKSKKDLVNTIDSLERKKIIIVNKALQRYSINLEMIYSALEKTSPSVIVH